MTTKNRKFRIFLSAIAILSFAVAANADVAPPETGYIEYKISGAVEGTKTVWFDGAGERYSELLESSRAIPGSTNTFTSKMLTIRNGKSLYTVNLNTKSGTKGKAPADDRGFAVSESDAGEKVGTETVLGFECDVYESRGIRVCVYRNIPLKIEMTVGGFKTTETAVVFKPGVSVSGTRFTPPSGTEIEVVDY